MQTKSKRIESLDAFRGICSFLIMITHFILWVPGVFQAENLPLIYGGFSWKLPYFFVLSGFVITLSYQKRERLETRPYGRFLINRFFRIYPIFLFSTIAMFIIRSAFGAGEEIEGASLFFNISWRLEPTWSEFIHTLLFDGIADTWGFNGPAWTLVYEVRYAILFPLMLWMLRCCSLVSMAIFVALSTVAYHIYGGLDFVDLFYPINYKLANICSMFNFMLIYVSGMMLALKREHASNFYNSLSTLGQSLFVAVAIFLAIAPLWIGNIVPMSILMISQNAAILIGILMWIVVLLNNETISKLFSQKPLITLGRISFSLYMWHMPIISINYMLMRESLGFGFIIPLSVIESLIAAYLSYNYIEKPFIAMGKRLATKG